MEYLPCSTAQLNLDVVLCNGQGFRWKKCDGRDNCWIGVAYHILWKIWRVDNDKIGYEVLYRFQNKDLTEERNLLKEYFQLHVGLESLYEQWTSKCPYFRKLLAEDKQTFEGIRILRQEPVEALFAFICSANNNIARITKMIEKFCELYGTPADISIDGNVIQKVYDFPTVSQLIANLPAMEQTLRTAGFGYRAASIAKTVQMFQSEAWISQFGEAEAWLNSLRMVPYEEAKQQLLRLPGVGPKVADCICLMALDKNEVVPVDRHVFNLTAEIYKPKFLAGKKANFSKEVHKQIGSFYIDLFGQYAGWIQSILFTTRLKRFKKL